MSKIQNEAMYPTKAVLYFAASMLVTSLPFVLAIDGKMKDVFKAAAIQTQVQNQTQNLSRLQPSASVTVDFNKVDSDVDTSMKNMQSSQKHTEVVTIPFGALCFIMSALYTKKSYKYWKQDAPTVV